MPRETNYNLYAHCVYLGYDKHYHGKTKNELSKYINTCKFNDKFRLIITERFNRSVIELEQIKQLEEIKFLYVPKLFIHLNLYMPFDVYFNTIADNNKLLIKDFKEYRQKKINVLYLYFPDDIVNVIASFFDHLTDLH